MISLTGVEVPQYLNVKINDLDAGLYLALFHGRSPRDQELDDWGSNGPMIGPLKYVHTTYASDVKLEFVDEEDAAKYFHDRRITNLMVDDDMLEYAGVWYGDWTVFYHPGPRADGPVVNESMFARATDLRRKS